MNKSSKAAVITLFLLTASTQIQCTPSGLQAWIIFFLGDSQPQNNPDQIPTGVTKEHYVAQIVSDLRGLPIKDLLNIEHQLKEKLSLSDIQKPDLANQKTRSFLADYVKTDTVTDLDELKKEGLYVTPEDYKTIPQSYENNMIARLTNMSDLNGLGIAQYFGESRKSSIREYLTKRNPNNIPYNQKQYRQFF